MNSLWHLYSTVAVCEIARVSNQVCSVLFSSAPYISLFLSAACGRQPGGDVDWLPAGEQRGRCHLAGAEQNRSGVAHGSCSVDKILIFSIVFANIHFVCLNESEAPDYFFFYFKY